MARDVPLTRKVPYNRRLRLESKWRPIGGSKWTSDPAVPVRLIADNVVTYGPNWPNWRKRLEAGFDCTTTLIGTRYSSQLNAPIFHLVTGSIGTPTEGFGRFATGFSPNAFLPSAPSSAVDSVAEKMAASAFLRSYTKATQSWAGGSAIAEFAETVRMLKDPIGSLYNHTWSFVGRVGRLKKVYARDPVKYGKLLGSLWLGYSFGVAPLVADVNDAYGAIKALSEDLGAAGRIPIFGFGSNSRVESIERRGITGANYAVQDLTTLLLSEVRYRGSVRCQPPGPGPIAENFGVGFVDILPSVWEGVPWSWLVDYFVNVNEMLDSIRLAYADFSWCNRSVRNRRVIQLGPALLNISRADRLAGLDGTANGGHGYTQAATVHRVAVGVPYPSWSFRIPGLPTQFANVSALYAAIRNSKPGPKLQWF